MKKILLFFFVPLTSWAVELHPEQECESFKTVLTSNLNQYNTTAANLVSEATTIKTSASFLQNNNDFIVGGPDYASIETINANADEVIRMSSVISNQTSYLLGVVSNVVCSACPQDSSGDSTCCDDVIALLDSISQDTANLVSILDSAVFVLEQTADDVAMLYALLYSGLNDITNSLLYADFLLEHGFGDVTNILSNAYIVTNRYGVAKVSTLNTSYQTVQKKNGIWDDKSSTATWIPQGIGASTKISAFDMLKVISNNSGSLGTVVNRLAWMHESLTNELGDIHHDQTNYFTFFRGELGVQGVLSDWQSEQVSGSYHDFLTNHYLTVVRGGPLSGNQSTKTNWFSRIETLLAALVFTDASETNTVDTSSGNRESRQLSSSYETANQAASNFSEDFKTTSQGIVSLYRSYFNTFDTAAMPSHVVLMKLSSDDSEDIEISFQSDSLGILVESCRVVTTFCWSSVGIFLLYKFLVWSSRCVILACQFIYRAISSVFKS